MGDLTVHHGSEAILRRTRLRWLCRTFESLGVGMLFKTNDKALSFEVAERTTLSGQKTKRGMNGGYMDRGLTDLDALLLAVRDPQTKAYLTEAVLAYRVGAYRLAIVGTWTAVAYDIIAKIRELASSEDDAQAREFDAEFDPNVERSNV